MYALFKKTPNGNGVEVEVLAYSEDKEELMELLPYEVERYARQRCRRMLPHEMRYYLPHGYEPLEHWTAGAFGKEEFKVVELKHARMRKAIVKSEINTLRRENEKYLVETLGMDAVSATTGWL